MSIRMPEGKGVLYSEISFQNKHKLFNFHPQCSFNVSFWIENVTGSWKMRRCRGEAEVPGWGCCCWSWWWCWWDGRNRERKKSIVTFTNQFLKKKMLILRYMPRCGEDCLIWFRFFSSTYSPFISLQFQFPFWFYAVEEHDSGTISRVLSGDSSRLHFLTNWM